MFKKRVLRPSCVQLWFYNTQSEIERESILTTYLDAEEHEQATRFRFCLHRQRFIIGRGLIREILAQYIGVKPGSIVFARNEFGKPYIVEPEFARQIKFNVSNSHHLGVIAITLDNELGIDLEHIQAMEGCEFIVESQFSEEEKLAFFATQETERLESFYGLWTCKEAYLKGKGLGLSGELKGFVMTDVLRTPYLLSSKINENDVNTWSFYRPEAMQNFSCCLAMSWTGCDIQSNYWPV